MVAAGEGHLPTVEQFLKLGATVGARNSLGHTALHFAAASFWGERPGIVELLITHGADPEAADKDGRLPIDYARDKGYEQTSQYLSELMSAKHSR
jgi:ankyrin repeat protein